MRLHFDEFLSKMNIVIYARVAELVDAHDSKSCLERGGSSILPPGTKIKFFIKSLVRFRV